MKREFDLSYKQNIIDRKVKVVTDCGEPVEIVKWNCKGNYPILAVIDDGDASDTCFYDVEGLSPSKKERIYVLTDEPEPDDEKIRKFLKLIIGEWSYDDLSAKGFKKENIIAWLEKQCEKGIVLRDTFGYEEGRQKGQEEGIMLVLDNPQKYGLEKQEQKPAEDEELTEFDKAVGVSIGTWNPKTPEQIQSVKSLSNKLLKLAKKQINNEQKPAWNKESSAFKDKLLELFQKFRYIKEGVPTNGDIIDYVNAHIQGLIDTMQKPTEWNEEDEIRWNNLILMVEAAFVGKEEKKYAEWLKSLKDKIQPQPMWSYNDEIIIGTIIQEIEKIPSEKFIDNAKDRCLDWLRYRTKSLKPQNTWKPNDEQMKGIECAIKTLKYQLNAGDKRLNSLYNDLKKLKEK